MIASCSERSVSSINCSAPPRKINVTVLAFGQPLNKLYLKTKITNKLNLSTILVIAETRYIEIDKIKS